MSDHDGRTDQPGSPELQVGVIDTGAELNEYDAARAVWQEGGQKHTTHVITADGEEEKIYEGKIVYAVPTAADVDVEAMKERHESHGRHEYYWAKG